MRTSKGQGWAGRMGAGILMSTLAMAGAWALVGTPFEGTDGNLQAEGGIDWDTFASTNDVLVGNDRPSGQDDDALRGKEDDAEPVVSFGSIPSNKSDLTRFYVVYDHRENGGFPQDLLYVSWFRTNTLGSANMDFEFNQSRLISANGSTPVRTEGDILVMFGFSGGGTEAALSMSRWTETGACEAASSAPCWGPASPMSGIAEGAVNDVQLIDPVSGATVLPYTFGEAAINMTAAGIFDTESCTSFGSAHVKSRSADSFTASMKDFIKPVNIDISNCATVTVRKNAVPDTELDFSFTASSPLEPANFTLEDDGDAGDEALDVITFADRVGGVFTIAEEAQAGWDLTAIDCKGDATAATDGAGQLTGMVEIRAAVGENVECVFTNTRRGTILVDQVTLPAGSAQSFAYGLSGPHSVSQAFSLTDLSVSHDSGELRPGTYAITASPAPTGWDLSGAICSDGSTPGAVQLDSGETVTCTFTHTQRGAIIMDVVTDPTGDPQPFDCLLTGGAAGLNESFSLVDSDPAHVVSNVLPGSGYALSEVLPEGWFGGPATCSDNSDPTNIDVSPGEIVECVLVVTKMGRVLVDKVTDPVGDPRLFDFTLSGGPEGISAGFMLADTSSAHDSGWLMPGSGYSVEETLVLGKFARPEWDITAISCGSTLSTSSWAVQGADDDVAFQTGDFSAEIDLSAGDTVRCAFTNSRRGSITIIKDAVPDALQDFDFTLTGEDVLETFLLDDDGDSTDDPRKGQLPRSFQVTALLEGSFTIAQADPGAVWDATSVECRDAAGHKVGSVDLASRTALVNLNAGEHLTCVFTDTRKGLIVVEKVVAADAVPGAEYDPQQVPFTFDSNFAGEFQLQHGESLESDLLPAGGGYHVGEQKPSGWEVTSSCLYPDGSTGPVGSIVVPAGGTVVCIFVNEMRLHPGSQGFWRNWQNQYDDDLFRRLLVEALSGSQVYATLFATPGQLVDDALAIFADIYDFGGISNDQKLTAELTSLKLNLAVSTSEDPEIRAMQNNNDICAECLLDLSGLPGAEELLMASSETITMGGLTIGDLIAIAESLWLGDLDAGVHLYDLSDEATVVLMTSIVGDTNQGRTLTADPASYPDNPTCVKQPGLPDGTEGMLYSTLVPVSGGQAPYTCAIVGGALPDGLFLDANSGEISGTPDSVGFVAKNFTFTILVTDSGSGADDASASLSITIHPHPVITTIGVPDAVMEMPYSAGLDATGGASPLTWELVDGSLPAGLVLDPVTGRISGTAPAVKPAKTFFATFTVQYSDGMGAADFATYSMAVLPSLDDSCSSSPAAPASLTNLGVWPVGADLYLDWSGDGDATGYDVVGGRMSALRTAGGDFGSSTDACLASGHMATGLTVAGTPAPGEVFWFLVRPMNCGGSGTWDSGGETQLQLRDASLEASPNICQ
jgi:hypothetical protein